MTIIEITVVLGLLLVVIAMIFSVLDSAQTSFSSQISRNTSNDQLRLAAQSIDRDVRSGNVLYDPATESFHAGCSTDEFPTCGDIQSGMSLRIYTQANSPTRGGATCVQWRITSGGELQRRSWFSSPTPASGGWRIVATNLTNRTDGVAAFSKVSSVQADLINIHLRTNEDPSHKKGSTVEVVESVTGRNTELAQADQPCGPAVPDPTLDAPFKIPSY